MQNKQTVLIVDDIADNLNVAANTLMQNDINVLIAQSGKEAVISAEKFIPDLILLDIMMPEMDGYDVCKILKSNVLTKEIPVIFLSAIGEIKNIVRGFELGAVDYVNKPFIAEELISRVKAHLKIHKQNQELQNKEKALNESNERLNLSQKAGKIGAWEWTFETNTIRWTDITFEIFGKQKIDTFINNDEFLDSIHPDDRQRIVQELNEKIEKNIKEHKTEYRIIKENNETSWIEETSEIIYNNTGKPDRMIGVLQDITKRKHSEQMLREKNNEIKQKHTEILSSIRYAKTIQKSMLPSQNKINKIFNKNFILFKPRDIVSGDFYYVNTINENLIFSVGDCTGHGIPGGFLTMLGITSLIDICRDKRANNPGEVLNVLRKRIKNVFIPDINTINGIDIAFCTINTKTNILQYAGAYNPLWIVRNGELIEYKATRNPIGFHPNEKNFENRTIQLQNKDKIYLFSDGYKDQIGGNEIKKFNNKQFRELIIEISKLPVKQQKKALEDNLKKWQGNYEQIDDITIMGIEWLV